MDPPNNNSNNNNNNNTQAVGTPPPRFYCHTCKKEIQPLHEPELVCPYCKQDFIEEIEEEDPPPAPAPAPTPAPNPSATPAATATTTAPPPLFFPMPTQITFNGQPQDQLLPIAQMARQLFSIRANNNGTFNFQGPIQIQTHTFQPQQPTTQQPQQPLQPPFFPQNFNPFAK
jgi:hypothetical protein